MKKLAFGIFMLVIVGLFTDPLFAKQFTTPECASSCNFMQSCSHGQIYDIYNCGGSYTAVKSNGNCRWDVEMKDGGFLIEGFKCRLI